MATLASFAGWAIVPNLASGFIHNGLLRLLPRSLGMPGSASYLRDRRIIYVSVVLSYLLYTLVAAYAALPPNHYEILGVPLDIGDRQLRTTFRRLSAIYHPDKGGEEATFRQLRQSYDTLADSVSRFAYDRFGPESFHWHDVKTLGEVMTRGFRSSIQFYVASLVFIFGLGYLQKASYAVYWRGLSFLILACIHYIVVTSFDILPFFRTILPSKVPFQHASLLQSFAVTVLVAINQVGPVLFPEEDGLSEEALLETAALAKMCHVEAAQAMQMTHLPFARGNSKTTELYSQAAEWMVQARIDMDPEVQEARRLFQQVSS